MSDKPAKRIGFRKYWLGIVFPRAKNDIWEYIKEHVAMALVILIAAVAASILSANGIIDAAVSEGYISDASNLARMLVALLILSLLYLLWSVIYFPVIIYNEQESVIQSYKDLYDTDELPTEGQVELVPQVDHYENSKLPGVELYAWIKVVNKTKFDLYDCRLVLDTVELDLGNHEWKDQTRKLIKDTNQLVWASLGRSDKIVHRGESQRIDIAKNTDGITLFTFLNHNNRGLEHGKPRKYKIWLRFSGKVKQPKEKHIQDVIFAGFLIYDEGKDYRRLYLTEQEPE